jgi:lipoate-protein ligase A
MAVDRVLLSGCRRNLSPATVRFYSWSAPTVSIGHGQSWIGVVDREECGRLGVSVVRRPTGGRAVLHGREFTYSVTAPVVGPPLALYGAVCDALVGGLRRLGVKAARVRPRLVGSTSSTARAACFASFSREEVEVEGRKLVGSAQRRTRGCVLQQGSMPIDDPVPAMSKVFAAGRDVSFADALHGRITWLSAHLPAVPVWNDLVEAMAEGFRTAWGVRLAPGILSDWEIRRADELRSDLRMPREETALLQGQG